MNQKEGVKTMPKGRPGVKIFCINDNTCYSSIASATKHYNIASSSISKQINGERLTAGGLHFVRITSDTSDDQLQEIKKEVLKKIYNINP